MPFWEWRGWLVPYLISYLIFLWQKILWGRPASLGSLTWDHADAEAEAPILWPPDAKSQLIGKDSGAGKDGRWEEKGMTEDEMAGWHHQRNGYEFQQILQDSGGQGNLCAAVHGVAESDTTEGLNDNDISLKLIFLSSLPLPFFHSLRQFSFFFFPKSSWI